MRSVSVLLSIILPLLVSITRMPISTQEETENVWTIIETQYDFISDIALTSDETLIAVIILDTSVVGARTAIEVFDVESGEKVDEIIPDNDRWMENVEFSLDGTYIAIGYDNHQIEIYDFETFEQITVFERDYGINGDRIVFSPDGQYMIGTRNETKIISTVDWSLLAMVNGTDDENIIHVAISPDSTQFATVDYGDSLNIHDIETGEITESFQGVFESPTYLFWNTDETLIFESQNVVYIFDVISGESTTLAEIEDGIRTVAVSPSGTRVLISTPDNILTLWDITNREIITDVPVEISRAPRLIEFGDTIIVTEENGTVYFLNIDQFLESITEEPSG